MGKIECYALFNGVNDSILKLNSIIQNQGYEFIYYTASDIEKNFSNILNLPADYKRTNSIKYTNGCMVSIEFHEAFRSCDFIPFGSTGIYLLKKVDNYDLIIENGEIQMDMRHQSSMNQFIDKMIRSLRLFKDGDISSPLLFEISSNSRHIYSTLRSYNMARASGFFDYEINDDDISLLTENLFKTNKANQLTELAEEFFKRSYEQRNNYEKIISLVTSLEAIFNRGPDQISHIIARHLSLIISSDRQGFLDNYKKIKTLYGLRSKIVHGQYTCSKLTLGLDYEVQELRALSRKAILYCLQSDLSKQELFENLNCKGFN